MLPQLHIIPAYKVDAAKWNETVNKNSNGLIYHSYEYLAALAGDWDALVTDDYQTIMPLPRRKKWGIAYLYTPAFIQQLGIVGNINNTTGLSENSTLQDSCRSNLNFEQIATLRHEPQSHNDIANLKRCLITEAFVKEIKQHFKYGDVLFNYSNTAISHTENIFIKNNCIIDLSKDYATLAANYGHSVAYSINTAQKAGCTYITGDDTDEAIKLYRKYNRQNLQHVSMKEFDAFATFCLLLQQQEKLLLRKVVTQQNELLSIALLLKDNKRYYNLINYTSPEGRKTNANYFLYDSLLKETCNQPMLFDFEGSNIAGIKSFYEKLGAINQPYYHWHFNKLPFPLNLIKQ